MYYLSSFSLLSQECSCFYSASRLKVIELFQISAHYKLPYYSYTFAVKDGYRTSKDRWVLILIVGGVVLS
jgi:hypothetical protein